MKIIVPFDIPRGKAIDILAMSLFADATITSRERVIDCIKDHLATFGEQVWPEVRGLTPPDSEIAELRRQAEEKLDLYCPDYS